MAQHVRDFTPTKAPSTRRGYIVTRCTQTCRSIAPFSLRAETYGGLPVVTQRGQIPRGNHQTVCVTERRSGVSVEMVAIRGRLHLFGDSIAGPVPTEQETRIAVEHLLSRRTTARRMGLRLEPVQASFAHRSPPAPVEAVSAPYDAGYVD